MIAKVPWPGRSFVAVTAIVVASAVVPVGWLIATGPGVGTGTSITLRLTPVWFIAGVMVPLMMLAVACGSILMRARVRSFDGRRSATAALLVAFALLVALAVYLLVAGERKYVAFIALAEVLLMWVTLERIPTPREAAISALTVTLSWALSAGLPNTELSNVLLNATGSSAWMVPAFVGMLVLAVLAALARPTATVSQRVLLVRWGIAAAIFAVMAIRNDNETAMWDAYHQSFFTSPADLVREHHWLLWDIPSQYGFLSVVAIAALPGATVFDSFHLLVAVVLFVEALALHSVLTFRRATRSGYAFSLLLICAALFSSQTGHYPFGARLYPQESLRFVWPVAVMFVAFLRYRARSSRALTRLAIAGYVCWLLACFWSFEVGVWTTVVWLALIAGESAARILTGHARRGVNFALLALLASICGVLACIAAVELFYRAHLGHGPDWRSYFEFSGIYATSGDFAQPVQRFGPGWMLVALVAAVAAVWADAIVRRQYRLMPLLASTWAGVWGTSLYYAGESYGEHVAMLSGVLVFALGTVFAVTARHQRSGFTPLLARLTFVPFAVILTAYALGAPDRMHDAWIALIRTNPLVPSASMPVVGGELLALERTAGIATTDRILYPNSLVWVKVSAGLILPLIKASDGSTIMQHAWLPTSPVGEDNTFLTLPWPRRNEYIERFLDVEPGARGWYVTYHEPAQCEVLSSRLEATRHVAGLDYNLAYCVVRKR